MSAAALLAQNKTPSDEDIDAAMAGTSAAAVRTSGSGRPSTAPPRSRGEAHDGRHAGDQPPHAVEDGFAVGSGLVVGFRLPLLDAILSQAQGGGVFAPNEWLWIDWDGVVTIINSVPEMGQGSMTTMLMIVADELDAEWDRIRSRPPLPTRRSTGTRSPASSPTR